MSAQSNAQQNQALEFMGHAPQQNLRLLQLLTLSRECLAPLSYADVSGFRCRRLHVESVESDVRVLLPVPARMTKSVSTVVQQ
jgi:hypothetical protein